MRRLWLLDRLGRRDEASAIAKDVAAYVKRSPKFARQQPKQWLSAAEVYLRGAKAG